MLDSDVLCSDVSVVHPAVDQFVGRVDRQVGYLDYVVNLVVQFAISALDLGNSAFGDAA